MNNFKVIFVYILVVVGGAMVIRALAEKKELERKKISLQEQAIFSRKPDFPIDSFFLERWSPRAFAEKEVSDQELFTLFEAARWAPSSYNAQPWRFVYAKKNTPYWESFLDLLIPFNQSWARNAGALIILLGHKRFPHNGELNPSYVFDTGAAWENLALQASRLGLIAHGIAGLDYDRAYNLLKLSADYEIMMMIAVGKPGDISILPRELQKHEEPSLRRPLKEFVFEGVFS